jgi:uncharacterized protein YkwD
MLPMKNQSPFILWSLAAIAIFGAGCDRKDTKAEAVSSIITGPDSPAPVNTPVPTPEPVPSDTLPAETGKLNVAAVFPGPGEPRVALVSPISVQFDAALLQGLALDTALTVTSATGTHAGTITRIQPDTLVFRPSTLWQPETVYSITLDPTLISADGLNISAGNTWQFTTVADVYTTSQAVIDECMSDQDVEMLAAVNEARIVARVCGENNRPAVGKLVWNCQLQQAAITHSEDMATNNFFSHTGSDGSNVGVRITRTDYLWSHAGENLAAGYPTITTAMVGLLNSASHCDTMMSTYFTEFGSGYRTSSNSNHVRYWTQNFARPFRR